MSGSVSKPILHLPPLGKPDPHQPYTGLYPDHRQRVIQKSLKGTMLWYYAMNIIRERIGKVLANPNDTAACQKREFEKRCSFLRKENTRIENTLPNIANQLNAGVIIDFFSRITKQNYSSNVALSFFTISDPNLQHALQDFSQQERFTNFYQYLTWLKSTAMKDVYEQFLLSYDIDPKVAFEKAVQLDPELDLVFQSKSWEELSDEEQTALFGIFVAKLAAEKYGLHQSSWKPTMPIDTLIHEIETNGPLYVRGMFGLDCYLEAPYKMQAKVDGQDVYAWKPNSKTKTEHLFSYSVVLVGAQKTSFGQELVYFIDTNDESNPAEPQKRRVFAMSYRKLCSDILDVNLIWRGHPSDTNGYAYYGPQKALAEEAAKAQRAFLKVYPPD